MSVTLASLRTQARQRADMPSASFVTDAELTNYINQGGAELHSLIADLFEDHKLTLLPVTLSAGGNTIAIPADFLRLRGLDFKAADRWQPLQRFVFGERYSTASFRQYRIEESVIRLVPEVDASGDYRLWYTPMHLSLVADADTADTTEGWYQLIVVSAAMKMLQKEESDISALAMEKAEIMQRIKSSASRRDAGGPSKIADIAKPDFLFAWEQWR